MSERMVINEQRPRCRFCGEFAEDCNRECEGVLMAAARLSVDSIVARSPQRGVTHASSS